MCTYTWFTFTILIACDHYPVLDEAVLGRRNGYNPPKILITCSRLMLYVMFFIRRYGFGQYN